MEAWSGVDTGRSATVCNPRLKRRSDGRPSGRIAATILSAAIGAALPAVVEAQSLEDLQALSIEELLAGRGTLAPGVHPVEDRVDREIGRLKLDALGVRIDAPTEAQSDYTRVWA